jgi:hypothetical protein
MLGLRLSSHSFMELQREEFLSHTAWWLRGFYHVVGRVYAFYGGTPC